MKVRRHYRGNDSRGQAGKGESDLYENADKRVDGESGEDDGQDEKDPLECPGAELVMVSGDIIGQNRIPD